VIEPIALLIKVMAEGGLDGCANLTVRSCQHLLFSEWHTTKEPSLGGGGQAYPLIFQPSQFNSLKETDGIVGCDW